MGGGRLGGGAKKTYSVKEESLCTSEYFQHTILDQPAGATHPDA